MKVLFTISIVFACTSISAQKYTYLGGGISLISARFQTEESLWLIQSGSIIDGGSYDGYLRQEITRLLSIEVGYSWRNYDYEYKLPGGQYVYNSVGFWAHQIPINVDLEVDVYKDRISAYASFGYLFCIMQETGQRFSSHIYPNGDSLWIEWNYIAESEHSSQFTAGIGTRFRLVDEFRFELEIGNAFSLIDLREYNYTYKDHFGNIQTQNNRVRGNYWYLKFRFSYPIQRAIAVLKKGISQI